MFRKTLLTLSISATLATISLAPSAAFAQFPPPPPTAAGGPPALAGPPPMGSGGAPRAGFGGPPPRLGAGPAPRGDLRALGGGRGAPAVASATRSASVSYNRFGGYSGNHGYRHGGSRYGYRAAYTTYAVGAHADYAYGRSRYGYDSDSDCYYVYRRYRRVLVCD